MTLTLIEPLDLKDTEVTEWDTLPPVYISLENVESLHDYHPTPGLVTCIKMVNGVIYHVNGPYEKWAKIFKVVRSVLDVD